MSVLKISLLNFSFHCPMLENWTPLQNRSEFNELFDGIMGRDMTKQKNSLARGS